MQTLSKSVEQKVGQPYFKVKNRTALLAIVFLFSVVHADISSAKSRSQLVKEHQIHSHFVYNFANFVEWPNAAFSGLNSKLKLCFVSPLGVMGHLTKVNGSLVGDRVLDVVEGYSPDDEKIESGCHLLFVDTQDPYLLKEFYSNENHAFLLSVGNKPDFASDHGIVNIFRVGDGAEIEINLKKANQNKLKINTDLLSISTIVE